MGIINTIVRSRDDLVKPKKKSYWGYDFHIELTNVKGITEKRFLLPTEKRLVAKELFGIEPIEQVIVVSNRKKSLGRFTMYQMKDVLDDMGFNVDTIISKTFLSDTMAVLNINGFIIPGWEKIVQAVTKFFPTWKKLFLTKLAPGKERLHIRMFEMNDGTWIITAHTEWNWISLNMSKIFHDHMKRGAGNYVMGTKMMYELLLAFKKHVEKNELMEYETITQITRWVYFQSLADSLKHMMK